MTDETPPSSPSGKGYEVVLTPLVGDAGSKVMKVERLTSQQVQQANVEHVAGGPYTGIVVSKAANERPSTTAPDTQRVLLAQVANHKTSSPEAPQQERRELRFWFKPSKKPKPKSREKKTDQFMQDLMKSLPRGYIGFIKRSLELMKDYTTIMRVELDFRLATPADVTDNAKEVKVTKVTKVTRTKVTKKSKSGVTQEAMVPEEGRVQNGRYSQLENSHETRTTVQMGASPSKPTEELAVSTPQTGGGAGNPAYLVTLQGSGQREEAVDFEKARHTGGGAGNPAYLSTFQGSRVEEEMVMSQAEGQTGGGGASPAYLSSLNGDDTVASHPAPITGGTGGNPSYLAELQGSNQPTDVTEKAVPAPVLISMSGDRGSKSYRESLMAERDPNFAEKQKVVILGLLEDAYPNILGTDDLIRMSRLKHNDVEYIIKDLSGRGLIQEIQRGYWIRVQKVEIRVSKPRRSGRESQFRKEDETVKKHDFQVITHVPKLSSEEQPTIAIITLLYCEKLAVDAMMNPKTTYIRYKAEGEGAVYTVGVIGKHRVVSTKLSRIGQGRADKTAAGSTVTRLLGTFNQIQHVLVVGVGGGMPCYDDDSRHVRLGDVVVSKPEFKGGPVYVECTGMDGHNSFIVQDWKLTDLQLTKQSERLQTRTQQEFSRGCRPSWEKHIQEALDELSGETIFSRPPASTDQLYKITKDGNVDMPHPAVRRGTLRHRFPDFPVVHRGVVGCGKALLKDDNQRAEFALFNDIKCIDSGVQPVMESIEGNRTESFALVRGISDYEDGMHKKEWQPYAALVAAAYMKAIVLELPHYQEDDF